MDLAVFEKYFDNLVAMEKKLLMEKGKEYTMSSPDKHENFKLIAEMLDIPVEKVCGVYWLKHTFAIINYLKIGSEVSSEPIEGRIQDCRNYLALLGSIIEELGGEEDI